MSLKILFPVVFVALSLYLLRSSSFFAPKPSGGSAAHKVARVAQATKPNGGVEQKSIQFKSQKKARSGFPKSNGRRSKGPIDRSPSLETLLMDEGVEEESLRAMFRVGEPAVVSVWKDGEAKQLLNPRFPSGRGAGENKVLNLSDSVTVHRVIAAREVGRGFQKKRSEKAEPEIEIEKEIRSNQSTPKSKKQERVPRKLSRTSYSVYKFFPGFRDALEERIKAPRDIRFSVRGPDHHFEWIDPENKEALLELRESTVSLGHGGEIKLQVKNEGYLRDNEGADFTIYENAFRITSDLVYQEFARVGVAAEDRDEAYRWFECEPSKGEIVGCAGVVPTDEGGDRFDLALLEGIEKVRFIRIQDTGTNFNNAGENTEGFDFDALRLLSAYSVK